MHSEKQGIENHGATIAIIGGGFTGTMLAVQLLRKTNGPRSVVLIERGSIVGRGVAYGTQFDGHLLNVRARDMSAYPDAPDHFARWTQKNYSPSAQPCDFVPRRVYGQYVEAQLHETMHSHPGKLRCIQDEAVAIKRVGPRAEIKLASGNEIIADKVVIALGNFPPADLRLPGQPKDDRRFVTNPWSTDALAAIGKNDNILLIGSGLTSVDTAVELRARGFEGKIHVLSRRGLLPRSHKRFAPFPAFWSENSPRTVRGLLRLIRDQVKIAEAAGCDWRAVIDSLRPFTQKIWRSLSRTEKRRFLRHVRPYWDVHRHRIAGRIAEQIERQLRSGEIQFHAGHISECCVNAAGIEVAYCERRTGMAAKLRVDFVINCTGPDGDLRRAASPLLAQLMQEELARPDELTLGLDTDDVGALRDGFGRSSDSLYALGPLRKGTLWETIAVPEIRVQVAELADFLAASMPKLPRMIPAAVEAAVSVSQ